MVLYFEVVVDVIFGLDVGVCCKVGNCVVFFELFGCFFFEVVGFFE